MGLWPEGNQDTGHTFWPKDRAEQLGEMLGWTGTAVIYGVVFVPVLARYF